MGYRLNRLVEPVFMAVLKPMLTEIDIHWRLESCAPFSENDFIDYKTSGFKIRKI